MSNRGATVAPAICIIEPTLTSNSTEKPHTNNRNKEPPCKKLCKKICRTIGYILSLVALGLALNYVVEHYLHYK